ncbi:two-component sensor histidine kinase, partial [Caulobacter sp. D4A]
MTSLDLILAAAAGAVCLAICATLWALAQRRAFDARMAAMLRRLQELESGSLATQASSEAFDNALVAVEDGSARLVSGEDSLAACAQVLDVAATPDAVVQALTAGDPDHAARLKTLFERGEACAF